MSIWCSQHVELLGCTASLIRTGRPYINFPILKSLLQVIIYGFIRDFADQSKIGNPDFLLLRRIECCFLDVRFAAATSNLGIRSFLSSFGATTDTLDRIYRQLILRNAIAHMIMNFLTILNLWPGVPFQWFQDAPRSNGSR